ncbi:atp-dependent dna helicase pif1 [Colletotrichum incanum]|uniref:ATP-dependent DNA helicase n=1 Tax=Colletotrichum incanum TaxID=1573173 RepID=A0A162NKM9_COLIC|nr:atp-dependent dna helicase pif1 [Colletotrichum incanum]
MPAAAGTFSSNNLISKRVHSRAGSLTAPEPKRQRCQREPEYIDLDPNTTGETNPDHDTSPHGGSNVAGRLRENGARIADPALTGEPIDVTVDRLVAEYSRGIPRTIYGKKAKYYVVWNGRQCGLFTSWAECERQVTGFKNAGCGLPPAGFLLTCFNAIKGAKTYEDAERLLRNELTEKLRGQARDERHSQPSPQHPSAAPSAAAAEGPTDEEVAPAAPPEEPLLCQEQQDAMDLAIQGRNLFITGSGGCGKSFLVKALYRKFRAIGKKVYLLTPTGQASPNIGGRTTFGYAGWTPNDLNKPLEELIAKSRSKDVFQRLLETQILIIDEISMVENQLLDRLSRVMSFIQDEAALSSRRMRVVGPFGGVQVIAVGDFCQLPPVAPFKNCAMCGTDMKQKSENNLVSYRCPIGHGSFQDCDKWAFKSPVWKCCEFKYVHLTQIHRQQDKEFVRVLQKCRLGEDLEKGDSDLLLKHPAQVENGTRLFSLRRDVDGCNGKQFARLPGELLRYWCRDMLEPPQNGVHEDDSDKNVVRRYAKRVEFKVHMPVILLANIDLESGLCNGSQGIICGFVPSSHVNTPEEPQERNYKKDPDDFKIATERYKRIQDFMAAKDTPHLFPEVKFHNGRRRVIGPDCIVNEIGANKPYRLQSRTQIPLAPAWAMTIHKSQSLSLDQVIVNLNSVFEKGQAYVALSRARSLQGLKVEGTKEAKLKSSLQLDDEVRKFLEQLDAAGTERA